MQFAQLKLSPSILSAAESEGYRTATPIQAQSIPLILAGQDVLGSAQTGTGKTAAFAMPILHRLASAAKPKGEYHRKPRCLVLCPTRELAAQIADSFQTYGRGLNLRHTTIFGGVGQGRQVDALRNGVDILVATPGRLMDLMEQRHVDLSHIEVLVLDEADRMLDMGFIHPIRKITAKLPAGRQTLLFSATMPAEIRQLANSLLRNPAVVQVTPPATVAGKIEETVYRVSKNDKPTLLAHLVKHLPMYRAIVFTRTKHGADRVVKHLHRFGIRSEAIHGNKAQNARQRALANFADDKIPVLVATDIASRGIDVDGITHVVNYDLTHEPETYVHRIGRTARAGASGAAVSFCDADEVSNLRAIERLIRRAITPVENPLPASTGRPAHDPSDPHGHHKHSSRGGEKHSGGQHRADRKQGHRGDGERPHGEHSHADRSHGDRSHADRPHASRKHVGGAVAEKSPPVRQSQPTPHRAEHPLAQRGKKHAAPAARPSHGHRVGAGAAPTRGGRGRR